MLLLLLSVILLLLHRVDVNDFFFFFLEHHWSLLLLQWLVLWSDVGHHSCFPDVVLLLLLLSFMTASVGLSSLIDGSNGVDLLRSILLLFRWCFKWRRNDDLVLIFVSRSTSSYVAVNDCVVGGSFFFLLVLMTSSLSPCLGVIVEA
jgi:hypothetical protein